MWCLIVKIRWLWGHLFFIMGIYISFKMSSSYWNAPEVLPHIQAIGCVLWTVQKNDLCEILVVTVCHVWATKQFLLYIYVSEINCGVDKACSYWLQSSCCMHQNFDHAPRLTLFILIQIWWKIPFSLNPFQANRSWQKCSCHENKCHDV